MQEKECSNILSAQRYSPAEFAQALGSPSFMAFLKGVSALAPAGLRALFKAFVFARVPALNRRFAKESGLGRFAKRYRVTPFRTAPTR